MLHVGAGRGRRGRGGSIITRNDLFGVNISGPEFAPWNGQTFPTAADFAYLKSKRVGFVRLPIAWESVQPTLNAALDSTYAGNIDTAIANAAAQGIGVVLEIHNFGYRADQTRWTTTVGYAGNVAAAATGVNVLGDGTLTQAHLVDLWTRLATRYAGMSGVIGLGIMNEPAPGIVNTNVLDQPNYPTSGFWSAINGGAAAQLADGTNPLGAGYGPAWTMTSGTGFGGRQYAATFTAATYVMSVYARTTSGTAPLAFILKGSASGNSTVTTTWTRFSYSAAATAGAGQAVFYINAASGTNIQVANFQLEVGSTPTTYVPNRWLSYAQAAINAVRAVSASIPIYVCGYNFSKASNWVADNYELATLTGGNLVFEAHQYFDGAQGVGGGGAYSGSYASYGVTASQGTETIDDYLAWATARGVTPYLGEFGVPSGADAVSWRAVQATALSTLRSANAKGTGWFYGANGVQPSNILNIAAADDPRLLQILAA